jgi:hypothetical protein
MISKNLKVIFWIKFFRLMKFGHPLVREVKKIDLFKKLKEELLLENNSIDIIK